MPTLLCKTDTTELNGTVSQARWPAITLGVMLKVDPLSLNNRQRKDGVLDMFACIARAAARLILGKL